MYKIKKYFSFLLILIMCISSVYAISFELSYSPIKDKIEISDVAKFKLEIKNNLNKNQTFRIYSLDYPVWDVRTEPIVNPIFLDVESNSKNSIELVIDPLDTKNIITGSHFITIRVKSKTTNEALAIPMIVAITSRESLVQGYTPTIITTVNIPKKIDPREEIPIKINLNNQNVINYTDLTIQIDSNLIKDSIKYELGPEEEKALMLTKRLNPLTSPQKDSFAVTVLKGDKVVVNPIVIPVEIIEYTHKDKEEVKKKFLKTEKEIVFYSNNPDYSEEMKIETSLFKILFTSTKPKAKVLKEDDKRYFVWNVKLDENNSMEVIIVENYRILFIAIILAIILVFIYYKYRSPLSIRKEVKNIIKREGGISGLNVILNIKNRGNKKIEAIELKEVIPNITNIEKDISIGTLKPTQILKHEKKGTIVKWVIDNLEVGEERVLSYKIRHRFPILGDFNLPSATAKFKCNRKEIKTSSNRLSVSS
ncbi:hypothetical protein ISS05_04080 [Candidatus Woesearchaeota archaeon]|nr:hypothetical protein [Candidatus Woesearchaeota archaeon]